jgi:adenine phosphoribosyltransferase
MERLRETLREAPIVERGDYQYFVHPVTDGLPLTDPAVLREITAEIRRQVDFSDVDKLVTPESMGIHHTTALSLATEIPFVVIRKREYGFDNEIAVHQETGYGESELYVNGVEEGDRVVLVDDVFATGGTLQAIVDALIERGVEIVDVVAIIEKTTEETADLPVDVTSLLEVDVVDGDVVIRD